MEQVSRDRQFSDWRRDYQPGDRRSFHRIGLGQVKQQSVPALQKVQTSTTGLMVLGKPGSGKSTFLKSLAMACIEDVEKPDIVWLKPYVPIFISLKPFATDAQKQKQFNLLDYIYRQEFCSWGEQDFKVAETILDEGRALVLLDGLDEVPAVDQKAVLEEVASFCDRFHKNRFLISCRTQNRHRLEGFEDVEIDDFKPDQVRRFIQHWFKVAMHDAELANRLFEYLQANQTIAELAVTPILLNLICVVFQSGKGDLPTSRAALYQKGIHDLLEGWDEAKPVQVRRVSVLDKLTPEVIEELLADIATTLFEDNDYFPEQATLERLISKKLEISCAQAKKVLRSLEENSGLLVERSEGFWSFSHLTFQEYFVAKWFSSETTWYILVEHIADKEWQEVFYLVSEINNNCNKLVKLAKNQIDIIGASSKKMELFLKWVAIKTGSIKTSFDLSAIRAFYFFLEAKLAFMWEGLSINLALNLSEVPQVAYKIEKELQEFYHELDDLSEKDLIADCYLYQAWGCYWACFLTKGIDREWVNKIHFCLESVLNLQSDSDFDIEIKKLIEFLPTSAVMREELKEWWEIHGYEWGNNLRLTMFDYRLIGTYLEALTEEDKNLIRKYYASNELLVNLISKSRNTEFEIINDLFFVSDH